MECCICFQKNEVRAVLPCGHNNYCAECIFKEITLLGNKICPTCRAPIKSAVFTIIPKTTYSELLQEYSFYYYKEYGIYFDSKAHEKWFLNLLNYECPICSPFIKIRNLNEKKYLNDERTSFYSVAALNSHLVEEHHMKVCEVCANSKRMFPHELKLYSYASYNAHMNGFISDPAMPHHIKCHACNDICYDQKLYLYHCRAKHVHCFICGVNNPKNFFANDRALNNHYHTAHFPCTKCDFVGESAIDLLNHNTHEHSLSQTSYTPTEQKVTTPSIQQESKKKKKKKPLMVPPGLGSNSPAPTVTEPISKQDELSFLEVRSKLSDIISEVLSYEERSEEVELANIIIELALNIMDYLITTTPISKLKLSSDMLNKLKGCIRSFSIHQWKMDCLIPCGLSPLHASKFNKYFSKYFITKTWKYHYYVTSADFKLYTVNELWLCCCYFYLLLQHLLHSSVY